MPKNVVIIPASGWTYFNNSSSQTIGQLIVDPITEEFLISGNTLNLEGTTSVNVGNGYGDIYIGNGVTPTNIIFDQSGEIKGDGSSLQLTFGSVTDYVKISTNSQFDLLGIVSASTTSNVLSYNSSTSRVNYTPLSTLFSFGNVLLNSVSGNTLIGKTVNTGQKLQVSGNTLINGGLTATTITAINPTKNQYICDIGLAADQTITTTTDTLIDFIDVVDNYDWYDTLNKRFRPTIEGYYHIDFNAWFDSATVSTGQYNIQLRKNGNTVAIIQQPTINNGTGQSLTCSKLVYLNGTSDYLDFTAYQSTGVNRRLQVGSSSSGTYATIFLLAI
jgi:hypothetical protein